MYHNHPQREKWQQSYDNVQVKKDKAEANEEGQIAIARGENPQVRGPEGSILGLIVDRGGEILNAKLIKVNQQYANKWLSLTEEREVKVIEKS